MHLLIVPPLFAFFFHTFFVFVYTRNHAGVFSVFTCFCILNWCLCLWFKLHLLIVLPLVTEHSLHGRTSGGQQSPVPASASKESRSNTKLNTITHPRYRHSSVLKCIDTSLCCAKHRSPALLEELFPRKFDFDLSPSFLCENPSFSQSAVLPTQIALCNATAAKMR